MTPARSGGNFAAAVVECADKLPARPEDQMRKVLLGLVVLVSVFFAGCPTFNIHPLYLDKENVTEPALAGKWVDAGDPTNGSVVFTKVNGSGYTMTVNDPVNGTTDSYDVELVRLGGTLYADIMFDSRKAASDPSRNQDMPMGVISLHTVCKMVITGDDLAVSTMEDDPIEKKSATGQPLLAYVDIEGQGVVVTVGTAALRSYVQAHATDGFSDAAHYTRSK
jgi:hypothetical protein